MQLGKDTFDSFVLTAVHNFSSTIMMLDWSGHWDRELYLVGRINVQVISGIGYCLPGVGTQRKNLPIEI